MHEIDKEAFGSFLSSLRKEAGWTQRDLAEKLFVSDKAVSKWERGISLPDISLLIPLAQALGVTVTELLEGKRMENPEPMEADDVERLVRKALRLSGKETGDLKANRRRKALKYFVLLGVCILEWIAVFAVLRSFCPTEHMLLLLCAMTAGFGCYIWIFIKERLPAYYDENPISFYADGIFKMSIPGVSFNNQNWPRVLKALRIWSGAAMVTIPAVSLLSAWFMRDGHMQLWVQIGIMVACLGGLFLPVYFFAREGSRQRKRNPAGMAFLIVIPLVLALSWFTGGGEQFSGVKLGYTSSKSRVHWRASYARLDGTMGKDLFPKEEEYLLTVVTNGGSLDMSVVREDGTIAFEAMDIPTGEYPLTLKDATRVTVRAAGHRGSFSLEPME